MKRVLLLVSEPWRSDDSGGNSLNNFVEGMQGVTFAQIYESDKMPDNGVCECYFQISPHDVMSGFLTHRPVGRVLAMDEVKHRQRAENRQTGDTEDNIASRKSVKRRFVEWVKRMRPEILLLGKKVLWRYSNWRTPELERFIVDFDPDVVYAPCYASPMQCALTRYVKELTGCKVITWSADDNYSLRQFNLDPFFWVNRLWVRHVLRKTYPYYDEFYSASEEEAEELAPVVGKQIGILRKGVVVPTTFTPREVHRPIRFIYAGGLYLNRDKILMELVRTLRQLNSQTLRAQLHIYTGTQLDRKSLALLNDGTHSIVHGLITPQQLVEQYRASDVAIHCESFGLKYRLMTRLSFSTKIIDCFQSGCAILAIAWAEHTGIKCLQREDAAICVTDLKELPLAIRRIVEHPELIQEYAVKAYECEKRNHNIAEIQRKLYEAFVRNSKSRSANESERNKM